jgi:hypothetical protein
MIDENNQEEVVDDLPEPKEGEEDTTDYKAVALKMQGMAKRFQTKLKKLAETPPAKPEAKVEPKEVEILDRVDRAVLSVKGITEPEEIELVARRKKETGRGLEELLATTWFKQLPPKGQVQLRRDVVNAKMKKAKQGSVFAEQSVV